jgi:hypothetical protein
VSAPATEDEGVYLASVSELRDVGGGLWVARVQLADGIPRYTVVPSTLVDATLVRLGIGAAITLAKRKGFLG